MKNIASAVRTIESSRLTKDEIKELQIGMMFSERDMSIYFNGHPDTMKNKNWRNFEKQFGYGKTRKEYLAECKDEVSDYESDKAPRKFPLEFFDESFYNPKDPSCLLNRTRTMPVYIPRVWEMHPELYL